MRTVNLGSSTTTLDTDTDVNVGEALLAENEDGLVDLSPQDLRLNELKRRTVDLDETVTALAISDGSGGLLLKGKGKRVKGQRTGLSTICTPILLSVQPDPPFRK